MTQKSNRAVGYVDMAAMAKSKH